MTKSFMKKPWFPGQGVYFISGIFFFLFFPHQKPKHPIWWWWWWKDFSLSIKPLMFLNSSTWHGMVMVPFWSKPYSSSASFNSCMKRGWLKYITGTTNLCCSSPWPTLIAMQPFGIASLSTCLLFFPWSPWWWWWWLWWWRRWRCKWKLLGLFSALPISAKPQRNHKDTPKRLKICECFFLYKGTHKKTRESLLKRVRDEYLWGLGALLDMAGYTTNEKRISIQEDLRDI